jgi:hypothetical protein
MGAAVKLRSEASSPAVGEVAFSRGKLESDGWFSCVASVEANGEMWEIELGMIEPYRADMLGFFEDLGRAASRGWEGELLWESEYAEMRVEAKASGDGLVVLDMRLRWPPSYEEEKQATLSFSVEAVERAAERMHNFLRMERGSRFHAVRGSRQWSPRPT